MDEDARFARLRAVYLEQKARGEDTGAIDAELIHELLVWIRALRARVLSLEQRVATLEQP